MQMNNQQDHYSHAALMIALGICRDAIWEKDRCNWIGSGSEERYGMPNGYAKALNNYFYDGLAGIGWYLLQVQIVMPHPVVEKTLHGVMAQLVQEHKTENTSEEITIGKLGFHTGWTGVAWVLWQAGNTLQIKTYSEVALKLLKKITQLDKAYWGLDVIDGAAGAVPVLIHLSKHIPMPELKTFILAIGDYLIEKADKQPQGWSWHTMPDCTHNLTGLGHGTAGFATAFVELYAYTSNEQYLQIAKAIISYEDSHFHAPQQNWPDYRNFDTPAPTTEPICSIAWCHGAPGIGISRLRMLELSGDTYFIQGTTAAIETTLQNLSITAIGNYSLCHGVFGNAELLLYAAEILNRQELVEEVYAAADDCIINYLNKGIPIPIGIQGGNETPDFMLGSSGIGYFFLRLAFGNRVPRVLVMQ